MMRLRIRGAPRSVTIAAAATIAACNGSTLPLTGVVVRPASNAVAVDGYAVFTVTNLTRETIHVDRCGERVLAGLDRQTNGGWQNEMAAVCILSFHMPPVELATGESVTDSVLVRNAGTYRVSISYLRGGADVLREARSTSFRVE